MSSGNYNAYNYPYQQSGAPSYPSYQSAPASNKIAQSTQQYQQPASNQTNDYISYQNQGYGTQSVGYHAGQDSSWGSNNYGATQATTSRAAQVLHNMSNNSYTANTTSGSQSGLTSTHAGTNQASRYGSDSTHSPEIQTQQPHTSYGQSQARPRSVNTSRAQATTSRGLSSPATAAGYPSQRTHELSKQQQRSNSPANFQYNSGAAAAQSSAAKPTPSTTTASQQYTDYDRRQLANVNTARGSQQATPPTTNKYPSTQTVAPPGPIAPAPSSVTEPYLNHGSTTVDPTAVYDPWSEYQRKAEAIRAQRAVEDAARAEEEKLAEEKRKAEEAEKAEAERAEAEKAQAVAKQSKKKGQNAAGQPASEAALGAEDAASESENPLEAEIRAMMAKMRELNGRDPALLARIWEEERRAKTSPKSPTVQTKPTAQPATATATATVAPSASVKTAPTANQKKKAVGRETSKPTPAKPATPAPVSTTVQAPTPMAPPVSVVRQPARPAGSTIWPPEKKSALAAAASSYLCTQNPNYRVSPDQIHAMLDGNPSYIELCVQLERMGLKLERAAFAKNLLSQVPEVNGARKTAPQPVVPQPAPRPAAPPAVLKKEVATSSHLSAFSAATPAFHLPYTPFSNNGPSTAPAPVAEMVPIKAELKPPADKEEAARKRSLSDLVDLTQLDEDEDLGPPLKRPSLAPSMHRATPPTLDGSMGIDSEPAYRADSYQNGAGIAPVHMPLPDALTKRTIVQPLDKKKALRRNNYNPATIARDVLLACGRHPHERQLNQHLELLRLYLPQVGYDSDLSTLDWAAIDPGKPPRGYFKDSVQTLAKDADDEDDSEEEESKTAQRQSTGESGGQARVQALPEATNPFQKEKRRGRPPRQSLPDDRQPSTPKSSTPKPTTKMTSSAPSTTSGGVGYSAFRQYGPDGQLLPKKRGRPVGWRKAVHGSPSAQAHAQGHGFTAPKGQQKTQPTPLRNAASGNDEPIRIDSRSPSVTRPPQYQSFKCKWKNCSAELHNLETLKKHVFKMHRQAVGGNVLPCLWANCGDESGQQLDSRSSTMMDRVPHTFEFESDWHDHIQKNHFDPLSWQLGDGPSGGTSDSHDSEAYLSDVQGRQVTPRIVVDPERIERLVSLPLVAAESRGRGRPPKTKQEQEARAAQDRLVSQKLRMGAPGMDRGGATLVNDKRRRGFIDPDEGEELLVDVEDDG